MSLRETPEFKKGRAGEHIVAKWFRARGWHVTPSYDYSGEGGNQAPRMSSAFSAYILPDLDVAGDGRRMWIEVKTKAEPTLHRITNTLEHGIPMRLFKEYKAIELVTGAEVYLVIYEECSGELLFRPIGTKADGRVYDGPAMNRGGMIFWARASFSLMGKVDR